MGNTIFDHTFTSQIFITANLLFYQFFYFNFLLISRYLLDFDNFKKTGRLSILANTQLGNLQHVLSQKQTIISDFLRLRNS